MPKFSIQKSIVINAPVDNVFKKLNDLNEWRTWSPWLIQEPEAQVNVAADGKSYSWEGKRVGSGNMKITEETENTSLSLELNFLKPWKSHADVKFTTVAQNGTTKVTWHMDSSLPWFMFWMKKMMVGFIGMDYERGLNMLKDYVEDGEVHCKLNFLGFSDYPGCNYIAIKRSTTMENMGKEMSDDLSKLSHFLRDKRELVDGTPFSMYHKWDLVLQKVSYTTGVPMKSTPGNLPADMISGTIPATKVYVLEHIGPYRHLGSAWTTLNAMMRNKEFKFNKKITPFEIYVNDPEEVPENELVTRVYFPVK